MGDLYIYILYYVISRGAGGFQIITVDYGGGGGGAGWLLIM